MKKIIYLSVLLLAFNFGYGQTTLSPGDIAITGVNSDNPDQFSFVLLRDVSNTTTINFTDFGWQTSGSFYTSVNEGVVTWTATSDLSCGTEIVITDTLSNTYSSTFGTASETDPGFALNAGGDQLLAYQGSFATPTFIFGVQFATVNGWTNATSTNTSAIPTGLTDGANAIHIGNFDNGNYDCNVTSDVSLILSAVSTVGNWNSSNPSRLTLGGCNYSCTTCSGGSVTWDGTVWSGGPRDLNTQVLITGDYDTSIGGAQVSFDACSVHIDSGANVNIADGDYIRVQNDITVNGNITVQPEGAVIQVDDAAAVTETGTITVIKTTGELNNWYEYTYWSSPVSGETIDGGLTDSDYDRRFIFNAQNFLDATAETGNNNATVAGQDDIDDNGNDWQQVAGATVMQPGIGYAATHSEALFVFAGVGYDYTFSGPFNNGIFTIPVYRNDSETGDNNWNLIGNPYPSAIDADLFLAANANVDASVTTDYTVDGAIFLWSQDTDYNATENGNQGLNFSDADYAIINGVGQTAGGDGVTPTRFIPSGQAFFISMANAAPAALVSGDVYTADVTFNNSMRVFGATNNSQFFKNSKSKTSSTSSSNKLWVDLTSDNGVFNQTLVGYVNNATNADDGMYYDAIKNLSSNTSAVLYTLMDDSNKKLAIQGRAVNSLNEDEIIKIGFNTKIDVATLYTLSINKIEGDFLTNNTVYLKDNLENKLHNLSDSDYTFTSEVGEFNERFEIVFNENALLSNDDFIANSKDLSIIDLGNDNVKFSIANSTLKSIAIFDLLGRQLYNLKGSSNSETFTLSNLKSSIYIAKVELLNGNSVSKKFLKK